MILKEACIFRYCNSVPTQPFEEIEAADFLADRTQHESCGGGVARAVDSFSSFTAGVSFPSSLRRPWE